jgi:hypothetical protein
MSNQSFDAFAELEATVEKLQEDVELLGRAAVQLEDDLSFTVSFFTLKENGHAVPAEFARAAGIMGRFPRSFDRKGPEVEITKVADDAR